MNNKLKKLPNDVSIGRFTYYAPDCKFMKVSIGKFCSIASNVKIGGGFHPTNEFISTYPAFYAMNNSGCNISFIDENLFEEYKYTTIGNDVWIGTNAIILDGVNIGDGAIIGAGAIVTKDIPAYGIAVGVPARVIKYRFDETKIKKLLKFKWWNKEIKWIESNARLFKSELFFEALDKNNFHSIDKTKKSLIDEFYYSPENLAFSIQFNKFYSQIIKLEGEIVLYGNGVIGRTIKALLQNKIKYIVDINDNNNHPSSLINLKFDKIIISVLGRELEIRKYLINELNIKKEKIVSIAFD